MLNISGVYMECLEIREAMPGDAEGIAKIHVKSWQETYRGIIPQDYLDNLSWEKRAVSWRKALETEAPPWKLFAATWGETIVGFANAGFSREASFPFRGEIYAIYLLQMAQGKGIGRKLFEEAKKSLVSSGGGGMYLWVLDKNPAVTFYKHLGGEPFVRKSVSIGGVDLGETAIAWKEI